MLKPELFLYDGDCGFCRFWVERWKAGMSEGRVLFLPYKEVDLTALGLSSELCAQEVYFLTPGGIYRGARAVLELLTPRSRAARIFLWLYLNWELLALVSEALYRCVANHRRVLSVLTWLLMGKDPTLPRYGKTLSLFLRGLSFVYLVAFLSFWVQVEGTIGPRGIFPWVQYAAYLRRHGLGFNQVPSLLWLSEHPFLLHFIGAGGALLGLLGVLGLFHPLLFFLEYLFYLSFVVSGGFFMSYQWDHLLLEAGFLAILFTAPSFGVYASRWGIFLLRWLLFRLLFLSGMVKILSQDPTWRGLTALLYHFETQPLPNPLSYWVHSFPEVVLKVLCALVFFWELILPWGLFGPRRIRVVSGFLQILFQLILILTGNYGFFNFLTIILCIPTLDDQVLERVYLLRTVLRAGSVQTKEPPRFYRWGVAILGSLLFFLSVTLTLGSLKVLSTLPPLLARVVRELAPFRVVNHYGLFAVMTTERYEIVFSGSQDGIHSQEYIFPYKPDDPRKALPFLPFHMPRLDWALWFAALGRCEEYPWVYGVSQHLLYGSSSVLRLFEKVPFSSPPKWVRSERYLYRFTTPEERRKTGRIWERVFLGAYCPPVRRDEF